MTGEFAGTRILTRSETRQAITLEALVPALRRGLGHSASDGLRRERIPYTVAAGSFHLVAGAVVTDQGPRFVTKVNGWFAAGVSGFVALGDAENGSVLAVMDAAVLTQMRTAALTAVASEVLAAPDATCLGVLGAGRQARLQAPAVRLTTGIERVLVWDIDADARRQLVAEFREAGFDAAETDSAEECASQSQVIVSVVPSTEPILDAEAVQPGSVVIALGADAPGKREHASALLEGAKIITDVTDLCAQYGELQHLDVPDRAGVVHAELGDIIAGLRPGRESADEIIVFDSTGNAVQDAVAASTIETYARAEGLGTIIDLRA